MQLLVGGDSVGKDAVTTGDRVNAVALGLGGAAMIGYWVSFFTNGAVRTSDDRAWLDFEKSFVLADSYLAAVGLAAAPQMWRGRPPAVGLGIAAGSATTFLGLMDLLYNIQHGLYSDRSSEMKLETALNVASLVLGPLTMVRMWRARHRLGA
jgi:hypothetical protein